MFQTIRKLLARLSRNDLGAIAVEFALIAPATMIMLYGLFEAGRFYRIQQSLDYAVEEGARYAALNVDATTQDVITYTTDLMNDAINRETVVVTVTDTQDEETSLYFKDVEASIPFGMFVYGEPDTADISITAHSTYLQLDVSN